MKIPVPTMPDPKMIETGAVYAHLLSVAKRH